MKTVLLMLIVFAYLGGVAGTLDATLKLCPERSGVKTFLTVLTWPTVYVEFAVSAQLGNPLSFCPSIAPLPAPPTKVPE